MDNWLSDTIDQIALAKHLAQSSVSCGQRIGFIAVDNAVEYMLVAYVEVFRRLVGGHVQGGIKKAEWDNKKRYFEPLLSYVASVEPNLRSSEDEINRFHDVRSKLYHTGTPLTISATRVNKYAELAQEVMHILFGIQHSKVEWDAVMSRVGTLLLPDKNDEGLKRSVSYENSDGALRFFTAPPPTAQDAIALVLYGWAVKLGIEPTHVSLHKSLILSGQTMGRDGLNSRLYEMRRYKLLYANKLRLTTRGRNLILSKYLIT